MLEVCKGAGRVGEKQSKGERDRETGGGGWGFRTLHYVSLSRFQRPLSLPSQYTRLQEMQRSADTTDIPQCL